MKDTKVDREWFVLQPYPGIDEDNVAKQLIGMRAEVIVLIPETKKAKVKIEGREIWITWPAEYLEKHSPQ